MTTRGLPPGLLVDDGSWLLVPAGQPLTLKTVSRTARTLLVSPHPLLETLVRATYPGQVDPSRLQRFLGAPRCLPRTRWVHEIAHRYLFERHQCKKGPNDATRFLEVELLKEWYFVSLDEGRERLAGGQALRDHEDHDRRPHLEVEDPLVERALRWIDTHLAEPVTMAALRRATHASDSALLRAFQRELRQAPATYIRTRRLDEAMFLLRTGRLPVGEVAGRVGYGSFAAFSQAFRARFGAPPSSFVPR